MMPQISRRYIRTLTGLAVSKEVQEIDLDGTAYLAELEGSIDGLDRLMAVVCYPYVFVDTFIH